ncbi:MAG: D-alanine--D-alanine ligase [Bacteroidetes bacterium]|nr:D-alanine--D-alanine ligase [Bacteroidota bacterium]
MAKEKLHVGLIYGGLSPEHEVSIKSARNVYEALDPERYRVTPILIDREGRWHVEGSQNHLLGDADGAPPNRWTLFSPADEKGVILTGPEAEAGSPAVLEHVDLDIAFPMLHGQNGEDGRIQGFLHTLGIPYVGPDVLASAACMDKEVTKRLLRDAGLPITPFRVLHRADEHPPTLDELVSEFGAPFFVKPANSGSSVGITKVEQEADYADALTYAFDYDRKILIEKGISGREIECAVLGNEHPKASVLGEIVLTAEFYTYDAKYIDADASRMEVPADIPGDISDRMRTMAEAACRVLGCEGMARVDFFLSNDLEVLISEINTIPGFTLRSMYPVMWEHTGLPIGALVDRLIQLGLERHARDGKIKTTRY